VQDLTGLAKGRNPFAPLGESMNASAMVSNPADNGLTGSVSEATADVPKYSAELDLSNPTSYANQVAAAPADHPARMWADVLHADDPVNIPSTAGGTFQGYRHDESPNPWANVNDQDASAFREV